MVHLPSATIRREGALPERDQGHRLSEAVRRGGAVRRVGVLQCQGGGGFLLYRGGGRVLQRQGGGRGVHVSCDQAAAARMPRPSTFFKAQDQSFVNV